MIHRQNIIIIIYYYYYSPLPSTLYIHFMNKFLSGNACPQDMSTGIQLCKPKKLTASDDFQVSSSSSASDRNIACGKIFSDITPSYSAYFEEAINRSFTVYYNTSNSHDYTAALLRC